MEYGQHPEFAACLVQLSARIPKRANIGSLDDSQNPFKKTIAESMENGLETQWDEKRARISKKAARSDLFLIVYSELWNPV